MITTFSASELIKKSAMTLCHFRKKEWQPVISERMLAGVADQERRSLSKLREMKGVYVCEDIQISYCFDEIIITDNKGIEVVEHKMSDADKSPEWFFQYSLIQCAFYYSLLAVNPNKKYETASFYIKQGHEKHTFNLTTDRVTPILTMSDRTYKLTVSNAPALVAFYITKAAMSMEYDIAKDFDSRWKFKEWEYLGPYIQYEEIK